jgi:histidine ammonia-lyase
MSAPVKEGGVLVLDGRTLALDDLAPIARGTAPSARLALSSEARERVARARRVVEEHVSAGDVVYGLTTGFGKLKSVAIPRAKLAELQENLVLSHCCGTGAPLAVEEVRLAQVLRLNGLARGHSGVRVELVEALARLYDKGFVPVVPGKGSVGASGDLAPHAHMAAACLGYGEAWVRGARAPAREALAALGERPLSLEAKEGLALINGTEVTKAIGVAALVQAENLSRCADAIAALSIEALLGSAKPFDERLSELKGSEGHRRAAANVRACLADSQVLASHAGCDRVQDPYSLRCVPQIHGASKTALAHVREVLAAEVNAVTDNPVLFAETGEVLSAGMFHGQPLSMALDYLAIALATLANVSERRTEQLVNPDLSRLPAFLTPEPGLNSGLMIAQVTAAALASENKVLAHPASVDTIPTSANQEDHVSMGVTAARKAREIAANVERVLAIEWLCAAQAREFRRELREGRGARAARELLRERVAPLARDRYLHADIEAAVELVRSGALAARVEAAVGPLHA